MKKSTRLTPFSKLLLTMVFVGGIVYTLRPPGGTSETIVQPAIESNNPLSLIVSALMCIALIVLICYFGIRTYLLLSKKTTTLFSQYGWEAIGNETYTKNDYILKPGKESSMWELHASAGMRAQATGPLVKKDFDAFERIILNKD